MNYKYNNLHILNKPENIYIKCDINKDYTIMPKNSEYIYKCSAIAHTKGDIKELIYSPISGRYLETITEDNNKYIVLQNDFKEINENLKGINKNIDNISYEEFILKLQQSGISKNNISIYHHYEKSNKKNLIIDLCGNTYFLDKYLLKIDIDELLETIDALVEINKFKRCLFLINKKDKKLIKFLEQRMGTYLKLNIIKISERKICKKMEYVKKKYNIATEDIIIENINNIYNIKNILKYNIPFMEKYIILIKDKNIYPLKVKNGTKISYILKEMNMNNNKYSLLTDNEKLDYENKDHVIDNNIHEIVI